MAMRTPLLTATAVALTVGGVGPATAAFQLDFTDRGWSTGTTSLTRDFTATPIGDLRVQVTSENGNLSDSQDFDGPGNSPGTASYCADGGGSLACISDGFGVSADDEITFNENESITVSFFDFSGNPRALDVIGLQFLDTFTDQPNGNNVTTNETAMIEDDMGNLLGTVDAVEEFQNNGGYVSTAVSFANISTLTFKANFTNDGQGFPDVALAGIEVVPLPAAAWMMVGGLGLVYGATRRRRARASAT